MKQALGFFTSLIGLVCGAGLVWITIQTTWFTFEMNKALIGYVGCLLGALVGVLLTEMLWEKQPTLRTMLGALALLFSLGCCAGLFITILGVTSYGQDLNKMAPGIVGFSFPCIAAWEMASNNFDKQKPFTRVLGWTALLVGIVNAVFFFRWWGGYMLFDQQPGNVILWTATLGYGFPMLAGIGHGTLSFMYEPDAKPTK